MNEVATIEQFFKDSVLNNIANQIIDLDANALRDTQEAYKYLKSAMYKRWQIGKIISENHSYIVEKCGSQRSFAEAFGYNEAVISNNKRGYEALLNEGCDSWDSVVNLLTQKQITITSTNFEKIGTLITSPTKDTKPQEQRPKDEKRLLELYSEVEEIKQRNEGFDLFVVEKANETLERIQQLKTRVNVFDPTKNIWKNRVYLDFVKSLKVDFITDIACDSPDPHHTDIYGNNGDISKKLPDYYTIPVSRETHQGLESGLIKTTELEIANALIRTMALFIHTHYGRKEN